MISKSILCRLYTKEGKSMQDIALTLHCSLGQVSYWMEHYKLSRRTISEAVYLQSNPNGDPFKTRHPKNIKEAILFGLGFGLYWGEGTKANLDSVRLGNT